MTIPIPARTSLFNRFYIIKNAAILVVGCSVALCLRSMGFDGLGKATLVATMVAAVFAWFGLFPFPRQLRDLRRVFVRPGDAACYRWVVDGSKAPARIEGRVTDVFFGKPSAPQSEFGLFLAFEYPKGAWVCRIRGNDSIRDVPLDWIVEVRVGESEREK